MLCSSASLSHRPRSTGIVVSKGVPNADHALRSTNIGYGWSTLSNEAPLPGLLFTPSARQQTGRFRPFSQSFDSESIAAFRHLRMPLERPTSGRGRALSTPTRAPRPPQPKKSLSYRPRVCQFLSQMGSLKCSDRTGAVLIEKTYQCRRTD